MKYKFNLEDRLINFVVNIKVIIDQLPGDKFSSNLYSQISRSSTSTVLNYAEAQGAESYNDFVHKIKIVLKELRECQATLKMIDRMKLIENVSFAEIINENTELISIFVKSVQTATRNKGSGNQ
jgi:four helix bundle protein